MAPLLFFYAFARKQHCHFPMCFFNFRWEISNPISSATIFHPISSGNLSFSPYFLSKTLGFRMDQYFQFLSFKAQILGFVLWVLHFVLKDSILSFSVRFFSSIVALIYSHFWYFFFFFNFFMSWNSGSVIWTTPEE